MSIVSKFSAFLPGRDPAKQRKKFLERYLSRVRRFDLIDKSVVLRETEGSPQPEKLDVWMEIIVVFADGQKRVQDLLEFVTKEFGGDAPEELENNMIKLIEQSSMLNIVELHAKPRELPYYYKLPVSQQNRHKAEALMKQDGIIQD